MCTVYFASVPTRPPPDCDSGSTVTRCAGAIGIVCGLPVALGPWSDLTMMPSLTIDVTVAARFGVILTANFTDTLPPAGTVRPLHRTEPPPNVLPLPADMNDVNVK